MLKVVVLVCLPLLCSIQAAHALAMESDFRREVLGNVGTQSVSNSLRVEVISLGYNPPQKKSATVIKRMSMNSTILIALGLAARTSGLTFDMCSPTKKCRQGRTCFPTSEATNNLCLDSNCVCLPDGDFRLCSKNSDCLAGESCADTVLFPQTVCGSTKAIRTMDTLRLARRHNGFGRTMDPCRVDNDCFAGRKCLLITEKMPACNGRDHCFCLPPEQIPCFSSTDCPKREICAETTFTSPPICVSKRAEFLKLSLSRIPRRRSPSGFTLDPCRGGGDCVGSRKCRSFRGTRLLQCSGVPPCACIFVPVTPCKSTGDCIWPEVCASNPFTMPSICVSFNSRDTYEGVTQLIVPYTCPLLIREDPPRVVTARQLVSDARNLTLISQKSHSQDLEGVSRLGGGLLASLNLVDHMVAISDKLGILVCTGALISPKWFLTAAHCNIQVGYEVSLGSKQAFQDGEKRRVRRVMSHPKFRIAANNFRYDLCVAEIEGGSLRSSKFMKINSIRYIPRPYSFVRTVGFGFTVRDLAEPISTLFSLRQVDSVVMPHEECAKLYQSLETPFRPFRHLHVCAGSIRGSCTACRGDSGAPIIQYQRGIPTIVGVSSLGVGCGTPGFPSVYTRLSILVNWLRKTPAPFYTSQRTFNENLRNCRRADIVHVRRNIRFCRV